MRVNGKEAFLHDADARNDDRILELRASCGAAGYGIYWMLIESMRSAANYKLAKGRTPALAFGFGVSREDLEQVIQVCLEVSLFVADEISFWSESLLRRLSEYEARCKVNRENGSRGGRPSSAGAGHPETGAGHPANDSSSFPSGVPEPNGYRSVSERSASPIQYNTTPIGVDEEDNTYKEILDSARARLTLAPRVVVSEKELEGLLEEFGEDSVKYHAPICSDWLISNGKTKKNYASFLRNWIRKDIAEQSGYYSPRNRRFGGSSVGALEAKKRVAATQRTIKQIESGEPIAPEKAAEILSRLKFRVGAT